MSGYDYRSEPALRPMTDFDTAASPPSESAAGLGLTDLQKVILPTGVPPGGICVRDAGRMHRRLTGEFGNCSHFHVMSRVAGGAMLFGDEEKEAFRLLMWRMAKFSGVEILTYCVMGNHFHLLIRIPKREAFLGRFVCDTPGGAGERRLLEHLKLLYSKAYLSRLESEIADLRRAGSGGGGAAGARSVTRIGSVT